MIGAKRRVKRRCDYDGVHNKINPEVTDYYVGLRFSCARLTPQKMSPTQYVRTVRCSDEVMCYLLCMLRYGTVPVR